ncbi:MAG: hypothetical protein HY299_03785 [Verrucomicrobia bacterium]|nr:hypothetical protein [Verrucomicrobiota bacterium]
MKANHSIQFVCRWAVRRLVALAAGFAALAAMAAVEPSDRRAPEPAVSTNNPAPIIRTNAPVILDYASFKIIQDRNIFNPNRTARASRGGSETEKPKPPKIQHATLVGIMSYAKGDFAFFDGSDSEFRKSLKKEEKIAGHLIVDIAPEKVTLSIAGKSVSLPVGGQIKRVEEGPWEVATGSAKVASAAATGTGSSESGGESASGGEDDVLKRLLKKREQESKNEK